MENEFIELVFHVWKTSSLNSFSLWCLILTKFPWFAWSYNELIELVFHVWKHKCRRSQISDQANPQAAKFLIKQDFVNQAPQGKRVQRETSSMNSFFIHGKRVQWTRFPYMEIEFFELDFYVLSHVTFLVNWVRWILIVINEISLKLCLTYNIVWVLWFFFFKSL